jgi:hypothetical protein
MTTALQCPGLRRAATLALLAAGCATAPPPREAQPDQRPGPGLVPNEVHVTPREPAPVLPEPPPRASQGSGPEGCFTRTDLAERTALATSDRQAVYAEALRRDGLTALLMPAYTLFTGVEPGGPIPRAHQEERQLPGGRRARVVVMPPTGGCGNLAGAYEFAGDGKRVWQVLRRVRSRRVDVVLCGCPDCTCERATSGGCGGARIAATTVLGYELPDGVEFAGEREVPYVEDWVSVQRVLPPQPECAMQAPPP